MPLLPAILVSVPLNHSETLLGHTIYLPSGAGPTYNPRNIGVLHAEQAPQFAAVAEGGT